eukprot:443376-Prymnesium_polylepis.1
MRLGRPQLPRQLAAHAAGTDGPALRRAQLWVHRLAGVRPVAPRVHSEGHRRHQPVAAALARHLAAGGAVGLRDRAPDLAADAGHARVRPARGRADARDERCDGQLLRALRRRRLRACHGADPARGAVGPEPTVCAVARAAAGDGRDPRRHGLRRHAGVPLPPEAALRADLRVHLLHGAGRAAHARELHMDPGAAAPARDAARARGQPRAATHPGEGPRHGCGAGGPAGGRRSARVRAAAGAPRAAAANLRRPRPVRRARPPQRARQRADHVRRARRAAALRQRAVPGWRGRGVFGATAQRLGAPRAALRGVRGTLRAEAVRWVRPPARRRGAKMAQSLPGGDVWSKPRRQGQGQGFWQPGLINGSQSELCAAVVVATGNSGRNAITSHTSGVCQSQGPCQANDAVGDGATKLCSVNVTRWCLHTSLE